MLLFLKGKNFKINKTKKVCNSKELKKLYFDPKKHKKLRILTKLKLSHLIILPTTKHKYNLYIVEGKNNFAL